MQFNTLSREVFAKINRDVLFYTNSYLNKSDALMSEDDEFVKAVEMHYTLIKKELFSGSDYIWGITRSKGKIIIDKNNTINYFKKMLPPDFLGLLRYDGLTNSLIPEYDIDKIWHYFYSYPIANNSNIDIFYIKYIRDKSDIEISDYINNFLGAKLALTLMKFPRYKSAGVDENAMRTNTAMLYYTAQLQDQKAYPFLLNRNY